MSMPGFSAEASIYKGGEHQRSTAMELRNSREVVPAIGLPGPQTFAECMEDCLAAGGDPAACFEFCAVLFGLISGLDYAPSP